MRGLAASPLAVAYTGAGATVLLVHGSFTVGRETFAAQAELTDEFRLGVVDRRGFGSSPDTDRVDFERDAVDIAALLETPAHLVGHSYGGIGCLLAAALRADDVRSLTVIEPPAFALAADDAAVLTLRRRLARVFERDSHPQTLYADFIESWGFRRPGADVLAQQDQRALAASAGERMPWEANIPLDDLAAAPFPKLVVSGGWERAPQEAQRIAGRAFAAVCDVLEQRLAATRLHLPQLAHAPQLGGRPFNDSLRAFLHRRSLP